MKYLFHNDIQYLINKRRSFLLLLAFVSTFMTVIYITMDIDLSEIMALSLGLNVDLTNIASMEILMYLFNISIYVFIIVDVYVKDIAYNLDNIFLRVKPVTWLFKKNILFILLTLIVKIIQYALILLLAVILNKEILIMKIVNLFIVDYCYILLIEYGFLLFYILFMTFKKMNLLVIIVGVVTAIIIPKNVLKLSKYSVYLLLITLLIQLIIYLLFKKRSKQIIENL